MANTAKRLAQFAVLTTSSGIYTTPTGTKTILRSFDVANTVPTGIPFRFYLVPRGGNPATSNSLCYNKIVPAENNLGWEGEQVLEFGDVIYVQALTAGLTATISGVEIA